ncbi:TRAM domain-containing protein [Zymobacter sp. IVIA_5232.4 C2]|uniref:TRAM domain-containing protein n=1 Tax=Zymobacter sp. IVIA_5232.4 C2 TaxID=3394855 RepID=UPI0039C3C957
MGLGQRRPPRKVKPRAIRAPQTPVVSAPSGVAADSVQHDDSVLSLTIERLGHDGRGIARAPSGKTVFVDQALPGEQVDVRIHHQRGRFDEAHVIARTTSSPDRVEPACAHFGVCGGCALQHLAPDAQLAHKRQVLIEHFEREGLSIDPQQALTSTPYGYRRRARLGVNVDRQGNRLLGYRRHRSDRVCGITMCPVLAPALERLLQPLHALIEQLEAPRQVGHIELLEADNARCIVVRQLRDQPDDEALWTAFGDAHDVHVMFVRGKGEQAALEGATDLSYQLDVAGRSLTLGFQPGDFFQVNRDVNRQLVSTTLEWLAPRAGTVVLDLFAGVGNFSLGLAAMGAKVHALEGQQVMVERLLDNAQRNGLDGVTAAAADLTRVPVQGDYHAVVLDPPRDGARAVCEQLAKRPVSSIAYVSCNPATLARDAAQLAKGGYRLTHAAVVDMFPQTAHLETLAVFERR